MYFKVTDGKVENSRTPLEGGFEQNGLKYECDRNRLVAVSETAVRDKTDQEIFEMCAESIKGSLFSAADAYLSSQMSPSAYAYTCMCASQGDVKAQANVQFAKDLWIEHDSRIDAIDASNFMNITEDLFDFSSMGTKPYSVREY